MKCEQEGCKEETEVNDFELRDYDEKSNCKVTVFHYCDKHASENGFCPGCGCFCAGSEEFDFPQMHGNVPGYCGECSDEIKADCAAGILDELEEELEDCAAGILDELEEELEL